MSYINYILVNMIFVLFPMFCYLLYVTYQKNLQRTESSLFLSFALLSSLYLLLSFHQSFNNTLFSVSWLTIPLLIGYYKERKIIPIILSFILVYYQINIFLFNPVLVVFEYVIYYILFTLKTKLTKDFIVNSFILLKTFTFSIEIFYINEVSSYFIVNFIYIFLNMIVFFIISKFIFKLFEMTEGILKLNESCVNFEKEKSIKNSLFRITHEIKNPIAVCKGYLDMIDLNEQKEVFRYIPIVKKEIARTLTLIEDYLDFSKLKLDTDVMDVEMLLEDTIMQLSPLFQANLIKLNCRLIEDEVFIKGDYNRLKQVLINILKNAIEAKNSEVNEANVLIATSVIDGKYIVKIRDNGVGMDDETKKHLKEMFYTTKVKGTGLGVSFSNEIIELHQGTLDYCSNLGEGTTVIITLPVYDY